MDRFLAFIGLAKRSLLIAAQTEAAKCRAYAEVVTARASIKGAVVVGGDYTILNNCYALEFIIPPWVKYVSLTGCYSDSQGAAFDAKRYRWLRKDGVRLSFDHGTGCDVRTEGVELDLVIDEKIKNDDATLAAAGEKP